MPFTYSIANGLGAGFIAFVIIRIVQGRAKDVHVLMWIVAAAFVVFFLVGAIGQLEARADGRSVPDAVSTPDSVRGGIVAV
jgi:hypothetical protein